MTKLPHDTSVLNVRAAVIDGLRLYSLPAALVSSAPGFYRQHATEARATLAMVKDASDLLRPLLEGGHSTIAGRLAGAPRNIGRDRLAEEIVKIMQFAGYTSRNPVGARCLLVINRRLVARKRYLRSGWQLYKR